MVNYCDSGKIVIEDMNQTLTEAAPEGFLLEAGMELGGLPRDEDSLLSSEIVGGFVDEVEDIMEERSSEDSEEGQEDGGTEEVLVRQNGVLTPAASTARPFRREAESPGWVAATITESGTTAGGFAWTAAGGCITAIVL